MSKRTAATASVAILSDSPLETIAKLTIQLEKLGNLNGDSFKTGNNEIEGIKIKECQDTTLIAKLVGVVELNYQAYILGQEVLGIKVLPEFTVSGCTKEEIIGDAKRQIGILTHSEKAKKIQGAIAKLQEFITKEDKKAAVMAEIEALGLDLN